MSAPRHARARSGGRIRSWSLWASLAGVNTYSVVAHAADALRRLPQDASDGWIAAPEIQYWLSGAAIVALILLVVGAAARRNSQRNATGDTSYRYLFESSPMPMWVMEEGTWRIVEVNETAIRKYGYSRDEFLSLTAVDLQVPEDRATLARQLRERDPVESAHYRRRHLTKRGETIIAEVTARPFVFRGNAARLILVNDVTARVRTEEELRETEQRYRDLFERSPVPMWVYDVETLRMLAVNDAAIRRYGYSHDEFLAMTILDLNVPEDVPGLRARAKQRDSEAYFQRHARHRARDGTLIEADISSGPVRFAGRRARQVLAHDVTERNKSEEAVARERALLRAVIDNLPDNIYVKDREFRYLLMNPAALAVRGAEREEQVLGRTSADFYSAEAAAKFDAEDREVMASGEPMLNRERVATTEAGERTWYLGTKVPLRNSAGNVVGLVGIGRNITELRRGAEMISRLNAELEQRVRERTAQLEAANRELEAFSYSVSHDLKAPLRSIDGFSRALREDFGRKLDAAGLEFLDRISAASQRMGELIDDLLALSRVTRAEMVRAPVNLSAMAEEIVSDLRKAAPGRDVHVEIAPRLTAQGDPNLLRVALQNLLANAWKFSSGKPQAEIEVGSMRRSGQTTYYVRDNGAGFDMAYADRLFSAFQRLHGAKEFPGTGVGLATVQRVIYRHGGRVWAEGAVDRGATFYFTLP